MDNVKFERELQLTNQNTLNSKKLYYISALILDVLLSNLNSTLAQNIKKRTEPLLYKTLVELAQIYRPGFLLGTHIKAGQITETSSNKKAIDIISNKYNMVSAGIYQRATQKKSRTGWSFLGVDSIVEFSEQHSLVVYAHPMFGSNGYLPDWLLNGNYSNEELLDIMEERIKNILTRHKGKIDILDVYNEGLRRKSQDWREKDNLLLSLGYHENKLGKWPVFLEKILVWSRKYGGEDLQLIYNENNNTLLNMPQS